MNPATVRGIVRAARERLLAAGIDANEAAMDAALLARSVLGWDLARLLAHETDPPPAGFSTAYDLLVGRRAGREPISSILGWREFRGLDFEVGPDVLAPRPETEIIIDEATACVGRGFSLAEATLKGRPTSERPLIIDVGTGSGCLAICLAREFPSARVVATDLSEAALALAARNARRHGVAERIEFVRASLLDGVAGRAALVVSNPPYIPTSDIARLDPEVREWEPAQALDGGPDGLDVIRALVASVPGALAPGGWVIMEFGVGQALAVERLVRESPLELVRIVNDLQGIPRTVVARSAASG